MRVPDNIRKTVVYIGRGDHGPFTPYGTGFVIVSFIDDRSFQTIVTAKHVIDSMGDVDSVWIRVNDHAGNARVLPLKRDHWKPHPDPGVDLMVCPTLIPTEQFDILHLRLDDECLTPEAIQQYDFGVGDDVFIAGMFVSLTGETKNLPIIRCGTIAAMPDEMIHTNYGYHDAYLIEARSTGGLSGSPVFLHVAPLRTINTNETKLMDGFQHYLMGMVLGHSSLTSAEDEIEVVRPRRDDEDDEERRAALLPLNTGIGIVLPFQYVVEAVNQDELVAGRREAMERRRTESAFVADAAVGMERPTKADNPSHKEDFNRLLDVAVHKPESDRET